MIDYIQFIFIICRFAVHLLTKICNLKKSTCSAFSVIHGPEQIDKTLASFDVYVLAEVEQGSALLSCPNSHAVYKCPF